MLLRRTAAGTTPVSLIEAKAHLRWTNEDEDSTVEGMLLAAVAMVGEMAGRALTSETWVLACDTLSGDLVLPKSPVTGVTSVKYYDAADTIQTATLGDYYVFTSDDYTTVRPKSGAWPIYSTRADALQVTFTAGYTTIPKELRQAVLLAVGDMYMNRGDVGGAGASAAIEALVSLHRLGWIAA